MSAKKHGLGRGLNELGLSELLSSINQETKEVAAIDGELRKLSVDKIGPGKYQPRKDMDHDALEELANSIRAQGIIQPIVVRPTEEGRYEIVAGERRWRAAQLAELDQVPVMIRELNDEAAVAMALIENIQREDLNPIEEANALKRLIEEFGLTHQELAETVGKSRASVTNLLRLLTLSPDVVVMVERGDLEMGHARALLALEGKEQCDAAKQVVAKGLSVRETERMVKRLQQPSTKKEEKAVDPDVMRLQTTLSDKLGAKVKIQHGVGGKGKLMIHYSTIHELEGILEHIQ